MNNSSQNVIKLDVSKLLGYNAQGIVMAGPNPKPSGIKPVAIKPISRNPKPTISTKPTIGTKPSDVKPSNTKPTIGTKPIVR